MKTTYRGIRLNADQGPVSDVQVDVLHNLGRDTGKWIANPLVHYVQHSPTGFNWGYHGSGPADLALAILLDHLGETPNPDQLRMGQPLGSRLHQFFKREFVAGWGDTWEITEAQISEWMETPEIHRHVKEHAKLWREMAEIAEEEFGPDPETDIRMMSSDPAFKHHNAPTVEWEDDDARE